MTTSFFEHQRIAKTRSTYMLGLFALAVLGIILAVYALIRFTIAQIGISQPVGSKSGDGQFHDLDTLAHSASSGHLQFFQTELFTSVAGVILLLILAGSLYKTWVLRHGGRTVAEDLGGRLLLPSTTDLLERRALHVVEEMAIASGVPVPPVYVLDHEDAVNAFAAGKSPHDAVVGLTRGSLRLLSRDELQGVIAHEFSHILHGDMRLNTRIIGLLHGIIMISMLGYGIMRLSSSRRHFSSSEKDSLGPALLFFGVALYSIGFIGSFFARLIKASVSRQREFLADASAVQYTRNPQGIGNALKKIGGYTSSGILQNAKREEASHMFFTQGFSSWLNFAFATHPPLVKRIQKIDPSFQGEFRLLDVERVMQKVTQEAALGFSSLAKPPPDRANTSLSSQALLTSIALPTSAHVEESQRLLLSLPKTLQAASTDPYSARLLIMALVIEKSGPVRDEQLAYLSRRLSSRSHEDFLKLDAVVRDLGRRMYLPLVDLSVSSLQLMSEKQFREFHETLRQLVRADGACSIFEFLLHYILLRHVGARFHSPEAREARFAPEQVKAAGIHIIENLARASQPDVEQRKKLYQLGMRVCQLLALEPFDAECSTNLEELNHSLTVLATAEPSMREYMMKACLAMIEHDGKVSINEAELFRAIGDALDCPVPIVIGWGRGGEESLGAYKD